MKRKNESIIKSMGFVTVIFVFFLFFPLSSSFALVSFETGIGNGMANTAMTGTQYALHHDDEGQEEYQDEEGEVEDDEYQGEDGDGEEYNEEEIEEGEGGNEGDDVEDEQPGFEEETPEDLL